MEEIRPTGHLSVSEFARVCDLAESHVRTQLSVGKIPSIKLGQRRWVPEAAVIAKHADQLVSPWTQAITLQRLRAGAANAGIDLLPDDVLIQTAHLFLQAAAEISVEVDERNELVATGD